MGLTERQAAILQLAARRDELRIDINVIRFDLNQELAVLDHAHEQQRTQITANHQGKITPLQEQLDPILAQLRGEVPIPDKD